MITRLAVWQGSEPRTVHQKIFKVVGLPEAAINDRLHHLEGKDSQVAIGYYPVSPEVHVSLTVTGDSVSEAEQALCCLRPGDCGGPRPLLLW